jgi:hypothetical protein
VRVGAPATRTAEVGFVADLADKARRPVEEGASQEELGRLTKSVAFDVKALEALRPKKARAGHRMAVLPLEAV